VIVCTDSRADEQIDLLYRRACANGVPVEIASKEQLRKYYHQPEIFVDNNRCLFPWYTMQIDRDGGVMPRQRCYPNNFGNILEQEFSEIWNGKKMRDFRKDVKKYGRFPACTRCGGVVF